MKYALTKYQKGLCIASAAVFVVWTVGTVIMNALADIGDKWPWVYGESIVFTAVLCAVILHPACADHKSFSERIEREYISLRRDLCCRMLLIENVCSFAMALCHMTGLTDAGTVIAKVGVINLFGLIMMAAIALCVVVFAVKAKELKYRDSTGDGGEEK